LLHACRLDGVSVAVLCGQILRPLDPAQPQGRQIEIRFAVIPAVARHKKPDPVFFLAGGPGQSAVSLAAPMQAQFARLLNRRDLVLVDQRGTGDSAPLRCPGDGQMQPLTAAEPAQMLREVLACRDALQRLPHGDLRHYTTTVAMADLDAVRQALGAQRINLVGGSYGTRAALEYLRQFPQHVRRVVLDGVAPPDMVLPASMPLDARQSLDALWTACESVPTCAEQFDRQRWASLLAQLPMRVTMTHPWSGEPQTLEMTPAMLWSWVRAPLYVPALAAGLPHALDAASRGQWGALAALAGALGGGRARGALATGQHFSVVCAEDAPRLAGRGPADAPADLLDITEIYRTVCAHWPAGPVPAAFYQVPPAGVPVLALSGGADPATPPRHAEHVLRQLGPLARHVVVPEAGHGVMAIPCLRDVVYRFLDAEGASPQEAAVSAAACAQAMPRPPAFQPVRVLGGSAAAIR
jgi:pimeloyl-ACP methyl ester carboxylesterase